MTKFWPIFSVLVAASLSLPVLAADVPVPDKKPKNAKGEVIKNGVMPDPAMAADQTSSEEMAAASKSKTRTSKQSVQDRGAMTAGAANETPDAANAATQKAAKVPGPGFPTTVSEAKAAAEASANPNLVPHEWPAIDIEVAKARCTQLLNSIDAVSVAEAPFREGDCGAPAPIRLISIGKNPEVALSPPAIITCDMAVALHSWIKSNLQPLAKKHLETEIVKIESMSDYSCRNAYGRAKNKLSEHGRANALDIRGFIFANAKSAMVLDSWGVTERDFAARVAATKATQDRIDKQNAAKAALAAAAATTNGAGKNAGQNSGQAAATTAADTVDTAIRSTILDGVSSGASSAAQSPSFSLGLQPPSRLGGPKYSETGATTKAEGENLADASMAEKNAASSPEQNASLPAGTDIALTKKGRFIREAHAAACKIFGTTLGPEANEAHRNHLHVDMAPRKTTKICE